MAEKIQNSLQRDCSELRSGSGKILQRINIYNIHAVINYIAADYKSDFFNSYLCHKLWDCHEAFHAVSKICCKKFIASLRDSICIYINILTTFDPYGISRNF